MEVGRSGAFLNTVSNRLAASSSRARFLGMIIGMSISRLIEQPGKAMNFELGEMESDDALWYFNLIDVQDSVGSLETIKWSTDLTSKSQKHAKDSSTSAKTTQEKPPPRTAKIVAIEEIESENDESDEEEDLIPYEKPDEDPYDSDEDPTLVQRNKLTAPV
jgi:telomere length regulation protein